MSISKSIKSVINAIATTVELAPTGIRRVGDVFGVVCDGTEAYLKDWEKSIKLSNRKDKLERYEQLTALMNKCNELGLTNAKTVEEFAEQIDKLDI